MPASSASLIVMAICTVLFAAGCPGAGLNQYPSNDKFGVFSVQDSHPNPRATLIGRSQRSVELESQSAEANTAEGNTAEEETAGSEDAPPVVKYLPEEDSSDESSEIASGPEEIEPANGTDKGAESHLADGRKQRPTK